MSLSVQNDSVKLTAAGVTEAAESQDEQSAKQTNSYKGVDLSNVSRLMTSLAQSQGRVPQQLSEKQQKLTRYLDAISQKNYREPTKTETGSEGQKLGRFISRFVGNFKTLNEEIATALKQDNISTQSGDKLAAEISRNIANMPKILQEGSNAGKALLEFVAQAAVAKIDPEKLNQFWQQQVANSNLSMIANATPREQLEISRVLTDAVKFIYENQSKALQENSGANLLRSLTQTSPQISSASTKEPAKTDNDPNTYLKIFQQLASNSGGKVTSSNSSSAEISADMLAKINLIITKAARIAIESKLIDPPLEKINATIESEDFSLQDLKFVKELIDRATNTQPKPQVFSKAQLQSLAADNLAGKTPVSEPAKKLTTEELNIEIEKQLEVLKNCTDLTKIQNVLQKINDLKQQQIAGNNEPTTKETSSAKEIKPTNDQIVKNPINQPDQKLNQTQNQTIKNEESSFARNLMDSLNMTKDAVTNSSSSKEATKQTAPEKELNADTYRQLLNKAQTQPKSEVTKSIATEQPHVTADPAFQPNRTSTPIKAYLQKDVFQQSREITADLKNHPQNTTDASQSIQNGVSKALQSTVQKDISQAVQNKPETIQAPVQKDVTQTVQTKPETAQTPVQKDNISQTVQTKPETAQTPVQKDVTQTVQNKPETAQTPIQKDNITQTVQTKPETVQAHVQKDVAQSVQNKPETAQTPVQKDVAQSIQTKPETVQTHVHKDIAQSVQNKPETAQTPVQKDVAQTIQNKSETAQAQTFVQKDIAQTVQTKPETAQTPVQKDVAQSIQTKPETVQDPIQKDVVQTVQTKPETVQAPVQKDIAQSVQNKPEMAQTPVQKDVAQSVQTKPETAQTPVQKDNITQTVQSKPETAQAPVQKDVAQSVQTKPETAQTPVQKDVAQSVQNKPETAQTPVQKDLTQTVQNKPETVQAPVQKDATQPTQTKQESTQNQVQNDLSPTVQNKADSSQTSVQKDLYSRFHIKPGSSESSAQKNFNSTVLNNPVQNQAANQFSATTDKLSQGSNTSLPDGYHQLRNDASSESQSRSATGNVNRTADNALVGKTVEEALREEEQAQNNLTGNISADVKNGEKTTPTPRSLITAWQNSIRRNTQTSTAETSSPLQNSTKSQNADMPARDGIPASYDQQIRSRYPQNNPADLPSGSASGTSAPVTRAQVNQSSANISENNIPLSSQPLVKSPEAEPSRNIQTGSNDQIIHQDQKQSQPVENNETKQQTVNEKVKIFSKIISFLGQSTGHSTRGAQEQEMPKVSTPPQTATDRNTQIQDSSQPVHSMPKSISQFRNVQATSESISMNPVSDATATGISTLLEDMNNPALPHSFQPIAKSIGAIFSQSLASTPAILQWLNYVDNPLSGNNTFSKGLRSWATLLVTLRLKQFGLGVSSAGKSSKADLQNWQNSINIEDSEQWPQRFLQDLSSHIDHLHSNQQNRNDPLWASYIPLPTPQENVKENGMSFKRRKRENNTDSIDMNFYFEIKGLGPIGIKANYSSPDISIKATAETYEGYSKLRETLHLLQDRLNELNYNCKEFKCIKGTVLHPLASENTEEDNSYDSIGNGSEGLNLRI